MTRCPATATGPSQCHSVVLDTTGSDRPWLTTRGTDAWISYHNNVGSTTITVWHSKDDGQTWRRVRSPILGQGGVTGASTFNNSLGPIVADPTSNYIYQPFMAGEPQTKGFTCRLQQRLCRAFRRRGPDLDRCEGLPRCAVHALEQLLAGARR